MLKTTKLQTLLANNLKRYRTRVGITQMELAERCDVSTSFIGEIEICRKFPSARTLQKLSDVLGVKPDQLFQEPFTYTAKEQDQKYMEEKAILLVMQLKQQINKQLDAIIRSFEEHGL